MCEDFLRNVTITVTPRLNNAGILTTILSTNFTSSTSGNATMDFIDVDTKRTNPIQFAVWDPSIPSYTLSMKGFACNNSVYATVSNTIKVQLPQVTFLPDSSACPQAEYSLEDNMIDIMGQNPLYTDKQGCSTAYNISSPYPAQYMFLQVYKDMKAFVSSLGGSSLYTLFHMSPILNCVQNATSTLCQNPFTTGTLSPNVNETIADFAGFGFFAAPYFSNICNPNATSDQLFRSHIYDYNITIDDYLLTRGTHSSDLWVPARKSVLFAYGIEGRCAPHDTIPEEEIHPCGIGLGIGTNQSHTHPWEVSSPSTMKFLDDPSWVDQPKAPVWTRTTNSTDTSIYLASYITFNGEVADAGNAYWYVCPWQDRFMGFSFTRGGGDQEGACSLDGFVVGEKELPVSFVFFLAPTAVVWIAGGLAALGVGGAHIIRGSMDPNRGGASYSETKVKPKANRVFPSEISGKPSLFYRSEFGPSHSTIEYGNFSGNDTIYTSLWDPNVNVTIEIKQENGSVYKNITIIPKNMLSDSIFTMGGAGIHLDYNASTNEASIMKNDNISRLIRYTVNFANSTNEVAGLSSVELGVIRIFKSGTVTALSSNGSYLVYNLTGSVYCEDCLEEDGIMDASCKDGVTLRSCTFDYVDGKLPYHNIQVGADFKTPDVFSVPAYNLNDGSSDHLISNYTWSNIKVESTLMMKYNAENSSSSWIPVPDSSSDIIWVTDNVRLTCPDMCGWEGHPWEKVGTVSPYSSSVFSLSLGQLIYNWNSQCIENEQVYVQAFIETNGTQSEPTEYWVMYHNQNYMCPFDMEGFVFDGFSSQESDTSLLG